jgi:uncharacterized protein YxeA
MRILKKIGIILGILALIIGALFIIFHDDTDTAKIAIEQKKSSDESIEIIHPDLSEDFKEYEESQMKLDSIKDSI